MPVHKLHLQQYCYYRYDLTIGSVDQVTNFIHIDADEDATFLRLISAKGTPQHMPKHMPHRMCRRMSKYTSRHMFRHMSKHVSKPTFMRLISAKATLELTCMDMYIDV